MAGYLPPMYVPLEPRWKHWPTYIYDTNYQYGINFYQPMLDYIDRQGRSASEPRYFRVERLQELPELPWSDGRFLWQDKPVEAYTRRELIARALDAEDQARNHLSHFKVRAGGGREPGPIRGRINRARRVQETRSVRFLGAVRLDDCLTFSVSKSGVTEEAVPLFEWTSVEVECRACPRQVF